MKIAINGNIIDTNNIYRVGKVKGNDCWKDNSQKTGLSHSGYTFEIESFNCQILTVAISGNDLFGQAWWENRNPRVITHVPTTDELQFPFRHPDYLERLIQMRDKLTNFRDEIAALWANNETIPQFDLFPIEKD